MPGFAELAMSGAPIAGGALLGLAAGSFKGTDVRALIKQDMELLDMIPPEEVERRSELQRVINIRIDDLIAGVDKSREIRQLATSYQGNWREIVVFVCTILFAFVWWNVSHARSNWLITFIVMVVLCLVAGVYAARGILRAFATYMQSRRRGDKAQ